MAKYQQYEEYKESGVEWLSQLPVDWNIERTKRMLFLRRELVGANSLDYQLLSLTLRGVIPRDISNGDGKIPADFSTYQEVEKKDLIFCLFDIDETPRTVGLSPENGMITGAYNVYKTSDRCSSRYAYYYFLHIDLRKGLRPFYTGLRKVVRSETFGNIKMPCPSDKEQTQIANFLDHETAQIDTLIEKQQTLIQLLKEKRQAVISHAVTKGLNPNAPMKDSGVEWLGEVPEHWEVTKIKYIAELTPSKAKILPSLEKRCSFVPMEKLKLDTLILDETRKIKDVYQGYTYFEDGDVLIAKVTPCFENQNMAIAANLVNGIGFGSSEIYVLRTEAEGLNQFLLYRLQESVFMQLGTGAMTGAGGLRRVPSDFINDFQFALPSISEQQEIVAYIETMKNTFNDLVSKAEQAIQLMQERRTALISAAVTGKIDVRGWQAPDVIDDIEVEIESIT